MKVKTDFFSYAEPVAEVDSFGIRDGGEYEAPAYVDYTNQTEWIAVVESKSHRNLAFIAVDNNIPYYDENGNKKKRCDAMLRSPNSIVFVELKKQRKDWMEEAIEQLKETIHFFKENHDISNFTYKKAYAANRRHPQFKFSEKEKMKEFRQETGVRLLIEANIKGII